MKTNNRYEISTLKDIADLTPDQQTRCLADLAQWLLFVNANRHINFETHRAQFDCGSMIWVDDNATGMSGLSVKTLITEDGE
jgi:hypothetical protein